MITLYTSGAHFGLPDASPFVTKAEVLLKMARLEYQTAPMSFTKAPKGKVPYIGDGDRLLGDSLFIRRYIETAYKADFSGNYSPRELSFAWSVERMLEEHFYWLVVHERWAVDVNFDNGPRLFFKTAPALVRPLVIWMIRRRVSRALYAQGIGRHSSSERLILAKGDIDSLSELMGSNRYLLGDRICGADATVFSFLLGALCPVFVSDIRGLIEEKPALTAYVERMKGQFYPDFKFAA